MTPHSSHFTESHRDRTKTILLIVLSATLALLAGCVGTTAGAPSTKTNSTSTTVALQPNVSVSEASRLRESGAFMLDVREPFEWDEFHMPDATLIPLGTLASRLNDIPKDRPIVVVCRSGNRSQQGRDILLKAGFTDVTSMDGGMRAWRDAGLPVTR